MIDDTQYHPSAAIITIVLNAVSFLSLAFVLTIYLIRWKKITSFPLRMVKSFYLCIACLVQNLYVLMYNPVLVEERQLELNAPSTSPYCTFEAILKVSSDLSSIVWTTLIIYSSFASIVLKKNLERAEIAYLVVGFLFCIVLAIIPIFFGLYGFNTYYCWFRGNNRNAQFGLKLAYYYAPLWIGFFLTIFMSSKVYKTLKDLGLGKRELIFFKRLMLFPFIMLGTAFIPTINLIYNFVTDDYPEWLDDLANIATGLDGLLNSIAYGFNPIIREHIMIVLRLHKEEQKDDTEMSQMASNNDRNTSRISDLMMR